MAPDVVRSTSKSVKRHAWCGTIEDLGRLAKVIEEVSAPRIKQLTSDYRKRPDDRLAQLRLSQAEDAYVELSFSEGSDTISGPWRSILPEIDRRSLDLIMLKANFPEPGERLSLKMDRLGHAGGVHLKISSSDPGWARQAFARLGEEVDKGIPKWNWVNSTFGWIPLYLAMNFTLCLMSYLILDGLMVSPPNVYMIAIPVALISIFISSGPVLRWIFPLLEIVGENGNSTGSRRLVYIVSYPITIALGVIVNLIS